MFRQVGILFLKTKKVAYDKILYRHKKMLITFVLLGITSVGRSTLLYIARWITWGRDIWDRCHSKPLRYRVLTIR